MATPPQDFVSLVDFYRVVVEQRVASRAGSLLMVQLLEEEGHLAETGIPVSSHFDMRSVNVSRNGNHRSGERR